MKLSKESFVIALSLLIAIGTYSPSAKAQILSSDTAATMDSDVLKAGTTAFAFDVFDFENSGSTTVNGVTFSGSTSSGGITLTRTGLPNPATNGLNPVSTMSAGYVNILSNLLYSVDFSAGTPSSANSLTFSGLTAGNTYTLQLFVGSTGGGDSFENLQDGSATGVLHYGSGPSMAYFITDTFTANLSGVETIDFGSPAFNIFNAVNLRDITEVPEPSTWALMLGGLALLVGIQRRRRQVS